MSFPRVWPVMQICYTKVQIDIKMVAMGTAQSDGPTSSRKPERLIWRSAAIAQPHDHRHG
jgi:hypothetical protein